MTTVLLHQSETLSGTGVYRVSGLSTSRPDAAAFGYSALGRWQSSSGPLADPHSRWARSPHTSGSDESAPLASLSRPPWMKSLRHLLSLQDPVGKVLWLIP